MAATIKAGQIITHHLAKYRLALRSAKLFTQSKLSKSFVPISLYSIRHIAQKNIDNMPRFPKALIAVLNF